MSGRNYDLVLWNVANYSVVCFPDAYSPLFIHSLYGAFRTFLCKTAT